MPIVVTATGPHEFDYPEIVSIEGMEYRSQIIVLTSSPNRYVITVLNSRTGEISFFDRKHGFYEKGFLIGSKKLPDNVIQDKKVILFGNLVIELFDGGRIETSRVENFELLAPDDSD